ncbi:uncharacterized protein LOC125671369 isoform X3 [Ostrea edulis]|uniref:uncharacterized protein LOC125671369 isoform X3 n=1 Tax=Ostrea edulis TaxID=37623 RepID=UPI0024AF5333|nr:uncharacterized protein LOC125671369 isoform X3 [Ostrea edulis]
MITMLIKWLLLLGVVKAVDSVNTECLQCNEVSSVQMCVTRTTCGSGEECYLEKVTIADLSVVYNAGCRSEQVCKLMSALSGAGKRNLVNCADCCVNSPGEPVPCNARLCGQQPAISTTSSSPDVRLECMSCNLAVSVHDCQKTTTTCQAGEECFLESVTTPDRRMKFNAGCRSKTVCNLMSSFGSTIGKRNLVNCAACCSDPPDSNGPCNTRLCGESSEPRCLVCDGLQTTSDCPFTEICGPNQTCYNGVRIVGSSLSYVYGCEDEKVCQTFAVNYHHYHGGQHVARSIAHDGGVIVCDSCCKGDLCNSQDCVLLLKNMTVDMFGGTTQRPSGNILG